MVVSSHDSDTSRRPGDVRGPEPVARPGSSRPGCAGRFDSLIPRMALGASICARPGRDAICFPGPIRPPAPHPTSVSAPTRSRHRGPERRALFATGCRASGDRVARPNVLQREPHRLDSVEFHEPLGDGPLEVLLQSSRAPLAERELHRDSLLLPDVMKRDQGLATHLAAQRAVLHLRLTVPGFVLSSHGESPTG